MPIETEAQFNDSKIPVANHCSGCANAGWDPDGNYCGHSESLKVSAGFGRSCATFRRPGEPCGPEGKLFFAK